MNSIEIKRTKEIYRSGMRIRLLHDVNDRMTGTVNYVDEKGQLHVKWDNGRTLTIIPKVDSFEILY